MAQKAKTKKTFTRVKPKQYTMVRFTSSLYDEEFLLPKPGHMSQKVASAIDSGRFDVFYEWLRGAGVTEEEIDAIADMDAEETREFMQEWGQGEIASVPKS
uniref:Uncharacterized protein n=1 Tax=Siphoviridae sp. ctaaA4 TaxID=2826388 RepID=A0A8S5N3T1_9CAUD|nr:MAG TPA: hypothetical protein [Siphoviridae sp. ctaaA4]